MAERTKEDLSIEQRIEMMDQIRASRMAGRPQDAQKLEAAMDRGAYAQLEGSIEAPIPDPSPNPPPRGGKGSSKENWLEYAKLVSDIDLEVLESAGQPDLIGMLEANGLIEKLKSKESGKGSDEE